MYREIKCEVFEVTEKLPDNFDIVLVASNTDDCYIKLAKFENSKFYEWSWHTSSQSEINDVTHWMGCPTLIHYNDLHIRKKFLSVNK